MKFLISEARKENSVLFLSGYFYPENKEDAKDLEDLISSDEEYHYSRKRFIKLDKGRIYIQNVTYSSLATTLKILSSNIAFPSEPEEHTSYIGNINEEGLKRILSSMLDGWSGNRTM